MTPFKPSTVLVTGALGQDGAYLCELALHRGCSVIGAVRNATSALSGGRAWRLRHLGIAERVQWAEFDLCDAESMHEALHVHRPDVVFNLAAQSSVVRSFEQPLETAAVNGMGAVNLFELARHAPWPVRIVQAASADILAAELDGPVQAASPYAAAKAFAHLMARVYRDDMGVFVSSAVLYNHESPLRGPEFVTRKIVAGLVDIQAGRQERLLLGNLEARRDWSHARDIVEGLWQLAIAAQPSEVALGSGQTHTVREFVDRAAAALGMRLQWQGEGLHEHALDASNGRTLVAVDPAFFRPSDTSHGAADLKRATALGWAPRTSLDEMIREMIQFVIDEKQRSPT
jgi:GDPmannose 4,6-dehydratase